MTPLEILANNPTEEQIVQNYELMRVYSARFAQHGDPRGWKEEDGSALRWVTDDAREIHEVLYAEWLTRGWDFVPGVVKPGSFFVSSVSEQ